MDHLPKNDFVSCTGHLENTGSLIYADLPNVDPFHCAICKHIKKSHLILSPISLKKSKFWEAIKLTVVEFYKISDFCFKYQILPLVKKKFQLFPLK